MKTLSLFQPILSASTLVIGASTSAILHREPTINGISAFDLAAWKRASPEAPNGYTPAAVNCPSTRPSLRNASSVSDQETAWLEKRRNNTVTPMRELLVRLNITGFDTAAYFDTNGNNASALPNIAIAVSGGGYRALMNGAGALAAFDSRTPNSTNTGQLGGLIQSATYLAGLSGGGWLVGSIYSNNFTSVQDIINTNPSISGPLWQFGNSILEGPATKGIRVLSTAQYYDELYKAVNGKVKAGFDFDSSLTDYWGRALSFQLINATDGGPAYTWSSIADDTEFVAANAPMPILVADGRAPGENIISNNATVYEFNPWEMGSFDPTVYGFAPMRYVGSNFTGGMLPDDQKCIEGFDNAGFVMGTSSSLFNQFILNLNTTTGVPDVIKSAIRDVLNELGRTDDDIADWTPNPFYHFHNDTNPNAQTKRLTLVDGGEDLQNIPLNPLIQPIRNVDVIFAVDSSADTIAPSALNWPNGTALVATYERSLNKTIQNGTAFPSIPDQNTFVNLGLNTHPTFFGCDVSNLTGPAPLVIYIPNHPYVYNSNVSTFTLSYNNTERNAIIENGYDVATMGNGTVDKQWPTCVGCAILSRSLNRTGTTVPDICKQCFSRYCWDGTVNSTTPAPFFPTPLLTEIKVTSGVGHFTPNMFGLVATIGISMALML
ncbi:lysophospholipase [Glonium stellatum]|uniref:Lysophospholipase n=1 Tax=Glonium stellatum TaxID=574774 RepID=A0A8E2JUB2_9PEZI|nr:lysophospholipase [Glonium stellatum]